MKNNQHPKWPRRHNDVLLWMLTHPGGTQYQCAKATGYSRWQISRSVNSPDFKAQFGQAMDVALRDAVARMFGC